jgi:hypothetical protein
MMPLKSRLLAAVALVSALAAPPVLAVPGEVQAELGAAKALGRATFRWLGVQLYDATLYTPPATGFDWQEPLALELVYARSVGGSVLLDSTLAELERIEGRQPDHPAIRQKLMGCFRDVDANDRYVASAGSADAVSFWLNGSRTCEISHPELKRRFLGIWLSDQSRAVKSARALRGE